MSEITKKTIDYLSTVKTVSVATCNNGKPSCRIMEIQKVDPNLKISFVARKSAPKMEQINKCKDACIVSHNADTMIDIRLFGKVETFDDHESRLSVWEDHLNKYFPGGVDDPELIVIVFSPEKVEYRNMKTGGLEPETEIL